MDTSARNRTAVSQSTQPLLRYTCPIYSIEFLGLDDYQGSLGGLLLLLKLDPGNPWYCLAVIHSGFSSVTEKSPAARTVAESILSVTPS